jgi:gliding motility-associated-like protein
VAQCCLPEIRYRIFCMKKINYLFAPLLILFFYQIGIAQTPNIHIASERTGFLEYENKGDSTCAGYTDGYQIVYSTDYDLAALHCTWTGWNAGISPGSNVNWYNIAYNILQGGHYQLTCTVYAYNHTTNKIDTAVLSVNLVGLDCYNPTARVAVSDSVICTGTCVEYSNKSITMPDVNTTKNYWTFEGGTPATGYTYNKTNPPKVCYSTAGRYATKLLVSNFDYFKDSITQYITVKDAPLISSSQTQYKTVVYPDTVQLQACASVAAHYLWQPAAGLSCSTCPSPMVSYPYQNQYQCIAWDNEGCADTCKYYLTIDYGKKQVYIPTAFTPNGDGYNDAFTLYAGVAVTRIRAMQIFDRYGELVFSAQNIAPNDESVGWNGTFRGETLAPDVFVCTFLVEYADGSTDFLTGDVTIVK